jgi:eukaryotic-like serine/threonine-protein kinase
VETELGGYQVLGRLAVGGMAEVFQVRALATTWRKPDEPEIVAVKRLLKRYRRDEHFVQQFINEANITKELNHPNIVRTFHYLKEGDDHLMVQELVLGRTLQWLCGEFAKEKSPLPPDMSLAIAAGILRALDFAHSSKIGTSQSHVVHRDVNPSNVLLSMAGEVKLFDFGVAEVQGLMEGEAGVLRGTVAYMSPESVMGKPVDTRTDLFAVGIILFEMLTGQRLFEAPVEFELIRKVRACEIPRLSSINSVLPPEFDELVQKALRPKKEERFQSAKEFLAELEILADTFGLSLGPEALRPLLQG